MKGVASTCIDPACRRTVPGLPPRCPSCGSGMRRVREGAVRGAILVAAGLFLMLFMGVIAWNVAPQMLQPGVAIDGSTFTGTAEQARTIFALFAAVILFGATSTAYGLFILLTGRQSRGFVGAAMALFAVLYAIGLGIRSWGG